MRFKGDINLTEQVKARRLVVLPVISLSSMGKRLQKERLLRATMPNHENRVAP